MCRPGGREGIGMREGVCAWGGVTAEKEFELNNTSMMKRIGKRNPDIELRKCRTEVEDRVGYH